MRVGLQFLDCNLHCLEVERYHPAYLASAMHGSVDLAEDDANAGELALPYFNLSVYGGAPAGDEGGCGELFEAHPDFVFACEVAHQDQTHAPLAMREAASVGTSGAKELSEYGGAPGAEGGVALLALLPRRHDGEWREWSGAAHCEARGCSGATLYEAAAADVGEEGSPCRSALLADFAPGALSDEEGAALLADVRAAAGEGATVGLYARRVRAARKGPPVGAALALAEKAREEARAEYQEQLRELTRKGEGGSEGDSFFSNV